MGNGMQESEERFAIIDDVDVETFKLFTEFCYTSVYRLQPRPAAGSTLTENILLCHCFSCGSYTCDRESERYPYCSQACQGLGDINTTGTRYCVGCGIRSFWQGWQLKCYHCFLPGPETAATQPPQDEMLSFEALRKPCSPALGEQFQTLKIPLATTSPSERV